MEGNSSRKEYLRKIDKSDKKRLVVFSTLRHCLYSGSKPAEVREKKKEIIKI